MIHSNDSPLPTRCCPWRHWSCCRQSCTVVCRTGCSSWRSGTPVSPRSKQRAPVPGQPERAVKTHHVSNLVLEISWIKFKIHRPKAQKQGNIEQNIYSLIFLRKICPESDLQPWGCGLPYPAVTAVEAAIGREVVRERVVSRHLGVRDSLLSIVHSKRVGIAPC